MNWLTGPFNDWIKSSYGNSWALLIALVAIIVLPALFVAFREDQKKER